MPQLRKDFIYQKKLSAFTAKGKLASAISRPSLSRSIAMLTAEYYFLRRCNVKVFNDALNPEPVKAFEKDVDILTRLAQKLICSPVSIYPSTLIN